MALCLGDDPSWRDEKSLAHLSVKSPLSSHNLNQQHFTTLLERATLDNNSCAKKAIWCFWSCLPRMTGGKGERHRREKEELSFQHPVQPAHAVELQQGAKGEERRTLVTEFLGAAKQWRAEGAGRK